MDYLKGLSNKLRHKRTKHELVFSKALKGKYHHSWIQEQVVIGNYIVDFLIPQKHLIVELDGRHHKELEYQTRDIIRDNYFENLELDVLRYTNEKIETNLNYILKYIEDWAGLEDEEQNRIETWKIIRKQNRLKRKGKLEKTIKISGGVS